MLKNDVAKAFWPETAAEWKAFGGWPSLAILGSAALVAGVRLMRIRSDERIANRMYDAEIEQTRITSEAELAKERLKHRKY